MYNDYDAKRAAIEEREINTGHAIMWYVDSIDNRDGWDSSYADAIDEYMCNGGSLPCWVVYDGSEHAIYDNEADAVEAAFDLL